MKIHYCRLILLLTLTGNALLAQDIKSVTFKGNPASPISSCAIVPANTKLFFSSGTVSPIFDTTATASYRAKVGTTKQQGVAILNKLKADLAIEGLSLKDVFFMRVFVAPDRETKEIDFKGWFEAYAEFFGTKENPIKPARSTLGVQQLVSPDKFLEIEIVAIYPK